MKGYLLWRKVRNAVLYLWYLLWIIPPVLFGGILLAGYAIALITFLLEV